MVSSHDFQEDKRNKKIKIYVNGKYYPRDKAKISVFDSSVLLGDGFGQVVEYIMENLFF